MATPQHPDYLETRSIGRLLAEFSMPAIFATVISAAYNFIARIFVGQKIGMIGITALTVSFPVMLLMLAFAMMVGTGSATLISIHLGEKRTDRAEHVLGQSLIMYIVIAVMFLALGLFCLEDLLRLFGASDEVIPYAKSYLSIIIWGTIFQEISFGINGCIRAEGRPVVAMVAMIIIVPINILLDWFFLFKLETGISGAAWAAVISQIVSSVWVCWYYLSGRTVVKWRLKHLIPKPGLMWKIILFGTVPLVTQSCGALVQGLECNILGHYGDLYGEAIGLTGIQGGDLAVALLGTIFVISSLMVMPLLGLSQGMQPIVGYNVGATRPDRVWHVLRLSLFFGILISTLFWIIGMFSPQFVLYPFVRADDPARNQIMEWGIVAIRLTLMAAPVVGVTIIVGGYFQAHGRPILSLILTLCRQLLFLLPLLVILPWLCWRFYFGSGLTGCWLAFSVSDFLSFLVAFLLLLREYKIKKHAIRKMNGSAVTD